MSTKRNCENDDTFNLPADLDVSGSVKISRAELASLMRTIDTALNAESNDEEADALLEARDRLSDWFES